MSVCACACVCVCVCVCACACVQAHARVSVCVCFMCFGKKCLIYIFSTIPSVALVRVSCISAL